ncbi:MAG: 6-phosphogluconolactonase [Candidatus Binatia bacterium]
MNRKAAAQFIALASAAIARSGRFAVALSGGSTPKALYSSLASPEFRERVDWPRVHLFWGDERCVAPDHPDSNFRMVRENLLAKIQLPSANIHRIVGEKEPRQAVIAYEAELKVFFGASGGALPCFDLIFLGLGDDGHTASLFPGSAALAETEHLVAAVYVEKLRSHRLTLTLPVINAAVQATFLVSGESKAKIVREILVPYSVACNYPAAKVRPSNGRLTWVIDADAAKELPLGIIEETGVLE